MAYAANTKVDAARSRDEIERLLHRYGAGQFGYVVDHDAGRAAIQFRYDGRLYRIAIPLPLRTDFDWTDSGRKRTERAAWDAWEQAVRSRWRSLLLVVKSKLVAVDEGIESFDQAFLSNAILPDGSTVAEWVEPQMASLARDGRMPATLPGLGPQPIALSDSNRQ